MKENNIEIIENFLKSTEKTLLINQINDEIGCFYNLALKEISKKINIRIVDRVNDEQIDQTSDIFGDHKIYTYTLNSYKKINDLIEKSFKKIIFTDYKNYKKFINKTPLINGYKFGIDINFFIQKFFNIPDSNLIDYCKEQPYLMMSEISKYLVNKDNYVIDSLINTDNNFILDIRKKITQSKRSHNEIKNIFFDIKNEAKYKKFNFLTY